MKIAVIAVLLYLFRRIEKRLDGSPTLIPLDEAWVYLRNDLFRDYLRDWLKTLRKKVHQTLRNVTRDFKQFEFNTIVSSLMELMNEMYKAREAGAVGSPEWTEAQDIYLRFYRLRRPLFQLQQLLAKLGLAGQDDLHQPLAGEGLRLEQQ